MKIVFGLLLVLAVGCNAHSWGEDGTHRGAGHNGHGAPTEMPDNALAKLTETLGPNTSSVAPGGTTFLLWTIEGIEGLTEPQLRLMYRIEDGAVLILNGMGYPNANYVEGHLMDEGWFDGNFQPLSSFMDPKDNEDWLAIHPDSLSPESDEN